ncbi:MAG: peptide deformylase [Pseudomonadales bacterium]|nr:peptide deformylase [Pseudomonadales bacterium]
MALLPILEYPDPRLRQKAHPVVHIDQRIRQLAQDMLDTMYDAPGIGLAAIQVNEPLRMLVLDVSEDKDQPQVFINPVLYPLGDERSSYDEGCLSVPGFYEPVERPARIRVEALNEQGISFVLEADGLLATCLQHEVDHLEGKLFVDYLSSLKRERIRKKLQKQHKLQD